MSRRGRARLESDDAQGAGSGSPELVVPEAAARTQVRDLDGAEHALGELWRERPVVLVFVRHFG